MALRPSIAVLFIFVYILTVSCHVEEDNTPSYNIFSDDDPHKYHEFIRYEERVKIIQKILAAECSEQHLQRLKRAILISGHGETQLFVEKILYEKMVRKLKDCRTRLAQRTSLNSDTTTIPTTTTTTPTTTTTTPTTTSRPQPPECQTAINLTESWRLDHNGSRILPISGSVNCDSRTMETNKPWFRFTGAAGDKMLDRCPPPNSCGSRMGIWTDASMPTNVGVSVSLVFYGSWIRSGCKEFTGTVLAMRCSTSTSHDLIYKFVSGSSNFGCDNSFCGMRSN